MGCKCCKPVVINTGGGGTGAVDSVTGIGVVDVTPTTGDSVVSITPGTTPGAVLITNPTETAAEWGPHLSSGTIALTLTEQSNGDPSQASTTATWTRIGNIVTVTGGFSVNVADPGTEGRVLIGNLPFPTAGAINGRVNGVYSGGTDGPVDALIAGRITNNNVSTTDVVAIVNTTTFNLVAGGFTFSYQAPPL